MATTKTTFDTGMFYNRHDAETAVRLLTDLGYRNDEISIMTSDEARARAFPETTGNNAAEGATAGGVIGGALGAIIAGITATGSIVAIASTGGLALPLVAGPLAAALAGLGAGGLAGGIIGALVGSGIPENRAKEIEEAIKHGAIVIGVTPRQETRERVSQIFTPRHIMTETGEIEASEDLMPDELERPQRTLR